MLPLVGVFGKQMVGVFGKQMVGVFGKQMVGVFGKQMVGVFGKQMVGINSSILKCNGPMVWWLARLSVTAAIRVRNPVGSVKFDTANLYINNSLRQ